MKTEKIIIGSGSAYPLNGLLTIPDNLSKPVPAVLMVHGSGPSNMDEQIMKLSPFRDLAEGLAGYGIASIRYDKRTFAHARSMSRMKDITVKEETIDDALLALDLLRKDSRVDPDSIFILGHSMGAMLAPRIDAEGGNVRGLVLMAGTPYRMEEIVLRQLSQAAKSRSALRWLFKAEYWLFSRKFRALYSLCDEKAKKKRFAGNISLYYFKEMGVKTASDYLLGNRKPVLIMQGAEDFQVLADDDFRKFQTLLAERPNTEYKLYPGLNHAFVKAFYKDILKASKEYGVERHISEEVVSDISAFITRSRQEPVSGHEQQI